MTEETSVDTIECPFCAEVIKRKAAKCKHCGSDLSAGLKSVGVSNDTIQKPGGMIVYGPGSSATLSDSKGLIFDGNGSQLQNLPIFCITLCVAFMALGGGVVAAILVIPFCLVTASIAYLKTASTHYRVTEGRIEINRGILFKASDNVLLVKIKDVKLSRGIIGNLFGVGTIRVLSSDLLEGELSLLSIPDGRAVYDKISAKLESIATRHGVVRY